MMMTKLLKYILMWETSGYVLVVVNYDLQGVYCNNYRALELKSKMSKSKCLKSHILKIYWIVLPWTATPVEFRDISRHSVDHFEQIGWGEKMYLKSDIVTVNPLVYDAPVHKT